jgi:hypothetical protein
MPIVVSPAAATAFESLVFNGTELNDDTSYYVEDFQCPPPPKKQEWIAAVDSDSSQLLRRPYVDKRQVTIRLRQVQQASKDACLAAIGTIIDKIQEAELKAETGGVPLVWTPANSSKSFTFNVLSGELTDLPISNSNEPEIGWFFNFPAITFRLDCEGPAYGSWVTGAATVTNSNPIQTVTLSNIPGDLPAELIVHVTDAASQARRHVEVGLESRYLAEETAANGGSAPALEIDSASLVTSGFAGASTTRSGSFNANVIRATLLGAPVGVCGTGTQPHVGNFRVKARIYGVTAAPADTNIRLAWQAGDGPFSANDWAQPVVTLGWAEVELGLISIPPAQLGSQKWSGRIESYTGSVPGTDTVDVDYLELIPTELYGKGRATYTYTGGATVAYDEFTGTTAGNPLNGRTAPAGGAWATSGAATDFAFADAPLATDETVSRATFSEASTGRLAIIGSTNRTDTEVGVRAYATGWHQLTTGSGVSAGAIARYTNASNQLQAVVSAYTGGIINLNKLLIQQTLGGSLTTLASTVYTPPDAAWITVRLVVYASGRVLAWVLDANGAISAFCQGASADLATGGTLATGLQGFMDANPGSLHSTRYYDSFYVATPAAEPIVVYSGKEAQFRYDLAQRQDSTGTYYGNVPSYRGAHLYAPQSGSAGRSTRILAKARRNDVDVAADDHVTDSTTLTADYRPRYLAVPR